MKRTKDVEIKKKGVLFDGIKWKIITQVGFFLLFYGSDKK